jgi:glycosyltransferase involved in cell wall biosynthesis
LRIDRPDSGVVAEIERHVVKIVHVVSGLAWDGGVQEYVSGLSRGLRDLGHEVVILTGGRPPPEGPSPHPLAERLDVRWHPKKRIAGRYLYPTGLWSSLRDLRSSADVVHVHQPFAPGTWLAAAGRTPMAATLYLHPEHLEGRSGQRRRRQLHLLLRRIDLLVAVSRSEVEFIHSVGTPRRTSVVWPAVTALPQPPSPRIHPPLVLSVSRLSSSKGLDLLLPAFARLPPEVDVAVVGGGPEAERCRAVCRAAGRDPDNVLRGDSLSDAEVAALMARADVFVSASRQESFGIAPLKAIAHGCRAVLSDIPSHREIVLTVGADEGLLFDPEIDPDRLSRLILSALDSPPPAADVASRVPTWETSAKLAAASYESMLASRRGPWSARRQRSPDSSSTSR